MPANNALTVSNLDFDAIKSALKTYVQAKPEFQDYNFQGSVINNLLDLLAYNTYLNSYYLSVVGNEMFLDSAVLRDSVVSRAKMLGYTPTSARSSSTSLNVTVANTAVVNSKTIEKGSEFQVQSDGKVYNFVTDEAYTIYPNDSNEFTTDITVYEGTVLTHRFTVSTANPIRYIIPNKNVDVTSLNVSVETSAEDSTTTAFIKADDINEVTATSKVYWVQEVDDELFEIYFGDDVIGQSLDNGNIVVVEYRVTRTTEANDIANTVSLWTPPTDITINNISTYTAGGSKVESIDAIKFNAPKHFETQNRAVLDEDYKRIIVREHGNIIQSLRVWGGEENNPPIYGKVFVSVNPNGVATVLSTQQKNDIKTTLKAYNLMSIDVEFIDPTYLYIMPTTEVFYDSTQTSLTPQQIVSKVSTAITNFETNKLGSFDNKEFRFSEFVHAIDSADSSIVNNTTSLLLQKRFSPNFNNQTKYTIPFNIPLRDITAGFASLSAIPTSHPGGGIALNSTSFTYSGKTAYLTDNGFGTTRIYYLTSSGVKTYLGNIGTIDYGTGMVVLNSFLPTAAPNNEIRINVLPEKNDITAVKYQLMLFGSVNVTATDVARIEPQIASTVTTTGSTTQINETAIGTIV